MPTLSDLQRLLNSLLLLSPGQILMAVIATSAAMSLLTDEKISTVLLLLQYILLPQLLSERLHRSLFISRLGIGFAIFLILYLTAHHMGNTTIFIASGSVANKDSADRSQRELPEEMGLAFRTLTFMLAAFAAHRLWRRYPLPPMPPELTLASYWLMSTGLILALVGGNPLRMGFGMLSFVNGFVGLYLFWNPGFLVTGLLNVVEMLLAVGIVLFAESWLYAPVENTESVE